MHYYAMRKRIMTDALTYGEKVTEAKKNGMNPPPYSAFEIRTMLKYGATGNMIKKIINKICPHVDTNEE